MVNICSLATAWRWNNPLVPSLKVVCALVLYIVCGITKPCMSCLPAARAHLCRIHSLCPILKRRSLYSLCSRGTIPSSEARVPVTMASGRWLHSYDKRLLPMPLRSFIWNESLVMLDESVTMEGAAGMACRIFESYLGALSDAHTGEWSTILANLQDQKELHTAVCLRLASKMISRYVDKRTVPKYLRKRGFDYATEMIKEVEMKIFKYIGFQLPLRSAVVEATTLAHNIGLPARSAEVAGLLTDMAELTMPVLVKLVDQAWTAPTPAAVPGNSSLNRPEVKQLQLRELVAGTVLAGGLYLPCDRNKNRTEELSQLARWASVETAFVQCTADSILKIVDSHRIWFDQQFSNKNSAKRRRRRL